MPEKDGKSYPVYKLLDDDTMLIPKARDRPAAKKFKPKKTSPFTLRPYQAEPVEDAVNHLLYERGLFLKAPCGTGKTVMALAICDRMQYDNVVILVDQKKLADQWEERIAEFLPAATTAVFHSKATSIDLLQHSKATYNIVVAQSLMTREWAEQPLMCDMLICDEAHVFSAPCFCQSIYNLDYHHSLALTATEDRKDGLTWVFMKFLASATVDVLAKTMTAKVISPEVKTARPWSDYTTAWCNKIKGLTWRSKCQKCDFFGSYPVRCGGNLPVDDGKVSWNTDKIMWTPMLVELFEDDVYLDKLVKVVLRFHKAGRQQLVFNQFRDPLVRMREKLLKVLDDDQVGIYTSKTKDSKSALECPITLTTYKMSQKGLDVPWKDAAILTSPVSDIRQTVGRITRIREGKKQPIIFDPVITNNILLNRQSKKRKKQYKDLGFEQ